VIYNSDILVKLKTVAKLIEWRGVNNLRKGGQKNLKNTWGGGMSIQLIISIVNNSKQICEFATSKRNVSVFFNIAEKYVHDCIQINKKQSIAVTGLAMSSLKQQAEFDCDLGIRRKSRNPSQCYVEAQRMASMTLTFTFL